ncbi:MAG: hypothetical protein VXZ55_02145, partial [Planctomycetota bacterium]|nr:hypothetical protein [Planctomycetota bacterium]
TSLKIQSGYFFRHRTMRPSKSCVLVCINNAGIQQRSKKADGRRDRAEVPCRGTVWWSGIAPVIETAKLYIPST